MIPGMAPLLDTLISDIDKRFGYHKPLSDEVATAHGKIRDLAAQFTKDALEVATEVAPYGREAALAVTAVEEAAMWLNAHIARNQPVPDAPVVDTKAETVIPAETVNATPSAAVDPPVTGAVAPSQPSTPVEPAPAAPAEVVPTTEPAPVSAGIDPNAAVAPSPAPATGDQLAAQGVDATVDPTVTAPADTAGPTGPTTTAEAPAPGVDPTRTL